MCPTIRPIWWCCLVDLAEHTSDPKQAEVYQKRGSNILKDLTAKYPNSCAVPRIAGRQLPRESEAVPAKGLLAAWLLAILSAVVAVGLADSAYLVFTGRTGAGDLNSVTNLLTPIVGLVGAATGFYFGSHADDHQEGH